MFKTFIFINFIKLTGSKKNKIYKKTNATTRRQRFNMESKKTYFF